MRTNTLRKPSRPTVFTAEGAPASKINALQQLRRLVMSCMLWEDNFYVNGQEIGKMIIDAVKKVKPQDAKDIAIEARTKMNLRHAPLLVVAAMETSEAHKSLVAETLSTVIQRADELAEFIAIYCKINGKSVNKIGNLSRQIKKGLSKAFTKFSEYDLAKYNRDNGVTLKDVLFMSHAKPKDKEQEIVWKRLIGGYCETCWKPLNLSDKAKKNGVKACRCKEKVEAKLAIPDTWETELSSGKDKAKTFSRLIKEKKLGALALLRNLRNMQQSGVEDGLVRSAIKNMNTKRVLPFRFVAAAKYAPTMEDVLEESMFKSSEELPKLKGSTIVLVDVSGSMDDAMSGKSEMNRMDAACSLAMICREICESVKVLSFSDRTVQVAPRRGFALREAIIKSQGHSGTDLGQAVGEANKIGFDRLIVITDEQSHTKVGQPKGGVGYMINVASNVNGVGYHGNWVHLDGFSESIINYISTYEQI